VQARRSRSFTRYDGNLADLADRVAAVGPTADGVVVSPTRLEQWVKCPHAYFVRYVLGVEPVEPPEAVVTLSPLERGSVVHAVLERYVSGHLGSGDDARRRLHEIADEELADVAARGVTGRRLLWQREQRLIHAELDAWFDADTRLRSEQGLETLATELHFAGVEIRLSDGRVVRMRGAADRVDRRADGTLVVLDYKNGSPAYYEDLSAEDPVAGGVRLQLPVYALAARARFAAGARVPVEAHYWFVGRGGNRWIGYAVDDAVLATFDGVLRAIVDGIEAGCFPAHPSPPGPRPFVDCPYCDPDGLGTGDRWREWQRKQGDPALAPYLALLAGDEEGGDAGDGKALA
jgi:RecB family exonuclease